MAVSNESGIAVADINAVLKLNRNKNKTIMTRKEPINISKRTPFIDALIKFAGLNNSGLILISCSRSDGLMSLTADSIS